MTSGYNLQGLIRRNTLNALTQFDKSGITLKIFQTGPQPDIKPFVLKKLWAKTVTLRR